MLLQFPVGGRHGRASISISFSSEMSGKAVMISGQTSRGNWLRCFQARTAPGRFPTFSANAEGPPFSSMMLAGEGVMSHPLPIVTLRRKQEITHGNAAVGSVLLMAADDRTWQNLSEPHERIRWARIRWQKGTGSATDAAKSLGMKDGTYRAFERAPGSSKHILLDHQTAARFAQKFKVNWIWLLTGEGTPFDNQTSGHVERTVRAMAGLDDGAQQAIADMAERLTRRTGTQD